MQPKINLYDKKLSKYEVVLPGLEQEAISLVPEILTLSFPVSLSTNFRYLHAQAQEGKINKLWDF